MREKKVKFVPPIHAGNDKSKKRKDRQVSRQALPRLDVVSAKLLINPGTAITRTKSPQCSQNMFTS